MRPVCVLISAVALCGLCVCEATAQTSGSTDYPLSMTLLPAAVPLEQYIDSKAATPRSPAGLGELIHSTLAASFGTTLDLKDANTYVLVHMVRWSDPSVRLGEDMPFQSIQFSRWYICSQRNDWGRDDFEKNNRIFGARHVWLLAVHLNIYAPVAATALTSYRPIYTVKSVRKTPAPLQHFAKLSKLLPNVPKGAPPGGFPAVSAWGGQQITIDNPADVTITPALSSDDSGKTSPIGDETKFDNEGRYWWDVGVAVPIRSSKDLTTDATTGTAVPKVVSKSNAFATIDVFFRPIDVKASGLRRVPHIVGGVTITERPLNAFFVGLGWGPAVANLYGGWLRLKLATPDAAGRKHDDQFTFGVELPLGTALIDKLSK